MCDHIFSTLVPYHPTDDMIDLTNLIEGPMQGQSTSSEKVVICFGRGIGNKQAAGGTHYNNPSLKLIDLNDDDEKAMMTVLFERHGSREKI
jgi:hypothetical protein